jgi:hypothetical protein
MTRPLKLDSSGSARVRFFDRPVLVSLHWAGDRRPSHELICPDSAVGAGCRACSDGDPCSERLVMTCWDVRKKTWAFLIDRRVLANDVAKKCSAMGITKEMLSSGAGPDFLLERSGGSTLVEEVPESVGQKRGDGGIPEMKRVLAVLARRSVWGD